MGDWLDSRASHKDPKCGTWKPNPNPRENLETTNFGDNETEARRNSWDLWSSGKNHRCFL